MFRVRGVYQSAAGPEGDAGASSGGDQGGAADRAIAGQGGGDALPEWANGMPDELASVVREARWDSPAKAVQSYRDLLGLKGAPAERLLKLPGSLGSDEARRFLNEKLGVPTEAEAYEFGGVDVPDGVLDLRDTLRPALLAAGVSKETAPGLLSAVTAALAEQRRAESEEADARFAQAKDALDGRWGGEKDKRWGNVAKAYEALGLDGDAADKLARAVGEEAFFLRLEDFGRRMGEPTDHGKGGGGAAPIVTQEGARKRLQEIREDANQNPNDPAVVREINRLSAIAFPGTVNL